MKLNRRNWLKYFMTLAALPIVPTRILAKKGSTMTTTRMPSLFIGHGSPMNAIQDNSFTQTLTSLGQKLPKPKAIIVFSAHWQTRGTYITSAPMPKTIHDFYGFPQELFDVQYPAPGEVSIVKDLCERFNLKQDDGQWGFDHGNWSVLKFLYPNLEEKVPVIQISLDINRSEADHFEFARSLRSLRDEGIMFVGSGNIVHNLRLMNRYPSAPAHDWNISFDKWVKENLEKRNFTKENPLVVDYLNREDGKLSNPSTEHYIPLLYTMGTSFEEDKLSFDYEGFEHASLSMRSVRFA